MTKKKAVKKKTAKKAQTKPTEVVNGNGISKYVRPNLAQPLANRQGANELKEYILWYVTNELKHAKLMPDQVGVSFSLALLKSPKLLLCSKISVAEACFKAALLGLEFSGATGDAYLVPFKKTCQLIPGYQGYIQAYMRSGDIPTLQAHVVYAGDAFDYELGTNPILRHKPDIHDPRFGDPNKITAAYMFAQIKGSMHPSIEVMSRAQIDAIRKRSRASGDGPWVTDFGEMARKTVLKRGRKWLPRIDVVDRLLVADEESGEYEAAADIIDQVGEEEPKSRAQALAETTAPKSQTPEPEGAPPSTPADPLEEEAIALMVKLAVPSKVWTDITSAHTGPDEKIDWSLVLDSLQAFAEKRSRPEAQTQPDPQIQEDMF